MIKGESKVFDSWLTLVVYIIQLICIAQIVAIGLGTCCPSREQRLLVSCSPAPHHVFPEGPLEGHGRNAVFDENALSLFCMKDSKEEKNCTKLW